MVLGFLGIKMKPINIFAVFMSVALTSCAGASGVRMSEREILVQSSAAPICGGQGAMKVAQTQAAIETIRAGYDRYVITGAASANNVRSHVVPGSSNTYGTANVYGNSATFNSTTTYSPTVVTTGRHEQSFAIRLFKEGEPGASGAISARSILGPKWAEKAKSGVITCN